MQFHNIQSIKCDLSSISVFFDIYLDFLDFLDLFDFTCSPDGNGKQCRKTR